MNKYRAILLGIGLMGCAGVTMAYLAHRGFSSGLRPGNGISPASMAPVPASKSGAPVVSSTVGASGLSAQMASMDPARRFHYALALRDQQGMDEAMAAWADADPSAAARGATGLARGPLREKLSCEVAQHWAARDITAAMAWATQSEVPTERKQLVGDICWQIGQTDPGQAISLAEQYGLEGDSGEITEHLAQHWAAKDPAAAVTWVLGQPQGDERNQFITEIVTVQSRISPAAAANLVVQEIPPGPAQDKAVLAVVDGWARQDLTAATAWVNQFPPDNHPLRDRALAILAAVQVKQAP